MKKHIMLFVILGAFFLCSCSSESQSNLPDNSRNESVQLNSNSLKMITSSWGAQEWCGTKDGFYYLNRADQNTYNISYIDYVSCVMTHVPLIFMFLTVVQLFSQMEIISIL